VMQTMREKAMANPVQSAPAHSGRRKSGNRQARL